MANKFLIHDEEDNQELAEMAGLHPSGDFQAVIVQLPFFRAEFKDRDQNTVIDNFRVFSFETEDDDGNRNIVDTSKMTQKPYSARSTMGKLLMQMFGVSKPDALNTLVPNLSVLLGMNFMISVEHRTMEGGGSPFAAITRISPIPVKGGKPVMEPIEASEVTVDYFQRKAGFKRIKVEGGKEMWFKGLFEEKSEEEMQAERTAQAAERKQAAKALKPAAKPEKPTYADDDFDDTTEEVEEVEEAPAPKPPTRPQSAKQPFKRKY